MPAPLRRPHLLLLSACLLLSGGLLSAQDWSARALLERLSEAEQLATGVHELTAQERANLENLIAYESASARAGNVTGFAGTFSSRRSETELDAAGLDRLSDEQRTRLDEHIAGHLAETPHIPYVFHRDRSRTTSPGDDTAINGKGPMLEVHGSVSITVGTSSAGSFYGGSATTVISDPKGRFNAVISYGTMRGNLPYYDRYYTQRRPFIGPWAP